MRIVLFVAVLLTCALATGEEGLRREQAVAIALRQNHDVIAARLNVDAVLLDRVQAGLYPNPVLSVQVGNLVVGDYNPQSTPPVPPPGFFGQTVTSVGVSEIIDVWAKRNTRLRSAERSIELVRLKVQDALREIVYAVRSAFTDVLREQEEWKFSRDTRVRYDETVRLSRARFASGDISETEFKKIELEGMRYRAAEIDAELELDLARHKLAALLGYGSPSQLPGVPVLPEERRTHLLLQPLVERALTERPDLLAARQAKQVSAAALAQARREALPDIAVNLGYSHSEFQVSGDNPNSLALGLSLPLPLFDRNQANIGRARLDGRRAENEEHRLIVQVQHDVADAVRRGQRGERVLAVYEGGMLERADSALRVAERSYKAGSISLLELLEAQRTYLETRAHYLHSLYEYRQALVDTMHAVGGEVK